MNNSFKEHFKWLYACLAIIIFLLGCILALLSGVIFESNHPNMVQLEQFGGATPMKIYQVYDRDTGVYYAVTSDGGITVMYTMEGKVKLVDEGDGALRHPNKGESDVQDSK